MTLKRSRDGNGWILRSAVGDAGLWFDTKDSALRWAEGMGINVTEEDK